MRNGGQWGGRRHEEPESKKRGRKWFMGAAETINGTHKVTQLWHRAVTVMKCATARWACSVRTWTTHAKTISSSSCWWRDGLHLSRRGGERWHMYFLSWGGELEEFKRSKNEGKMVSAKLLLTYRRTRDGRGFHLYILLTDTRVFMSLWPRGHVLQSRTVSKSVYKTFIIWVLCLYFVDS